VTELHPQVPLLTQRIVLDAKAFREGRLTIQGLSEDLRISIAALGQFADENWVEELRTLRNQIEYINALFVDSGRADLTDEERREVDQTLDELLAELTVH
jgi:hypothetical protein